MMVGLSDDPRLRMKTWRDRMKRCLKIAVVSFWTFELFRRIYRVRWEGLTAAGNYDYLVPCEMRRRRRRMKWWMKERQKYPFWVFWTRQWR